MTCNEAREYLFAFLDNELDAPLSIELQRHFDRCPICAREVEIERTIHRALSKVLEEGATEPPFEEVALARAIEQSAFSRPMGWMSRRWVLAASLAVLVTLVPAVFLTMRDEVVPHRAHLADLLVADFTHFLQEGGQVQIASTEPDTVSEWLSTKTGLAVKLPITSKEHCKLIGGRKCRISGRPAAFAVYDIGGVPASLVIIKADPETVEDIEPGDDWKRPLAPGERAYWVDRCKGHTVLASRRDTLLYAAVSTLPEDELECLVTDRSYGRR